MKSNCNGNKAAASEGLRDNLINLHQQVFQEKLSPAQQTENPDEDINLQIEDIEDQLLRMSLDIGEAQKGIRKEQNSLRDEVAGIHSRIARLEDNLATRTGRGKSRFCRLSAIFAVTVITTVIATFGLIELNSASNQRSLSTQATGSDTPVAARQIQDRPSR